MVCGLRDLQNSAGTVSSPSETHSHNRELASPFRIPVIQHHPAYSLNPSSGNSANNVTMAAGLAKPLRSFPFSDGSLKPGHLRLPSCSSIARENMRRITCKILFDVAV